MRLLHSFIVCQKIIYDCLYHVNCCDCCCDFSFKHVLLHDTTYEICNSVIRTQVLKFMKRLMLIPCCCKLFGVKGTTKVSMIFVT